MGKEEFVKEITNIDEDFAKWYTDIVIKAELADYTDTKGCIAIKPYGYAIWENIQKYADEKFKETGVKNVYLFGSYARGEANSNSDVDIYCDSGDVDTLFKAVAFNKELEIALGKKVDVVTIGSRMNDYFKQQLEEDMIKIC